MTSPFKIVDLTLKLDKKVPLTASEMGAVMGQIVTGEASDEQIENFLLSLRKKGETAIEIASAAAVMRKHATRLPLEIPDLLDTCGTGGDEKGTINVSTLSALVACAAGARVAKHGNRSVSSVCGSADLLELLGVKVDLGPEQVAACIETTGFGFFFAPKFHPAMRYAMPARKRIRGKTVFNVLGPLSNPAGATHQLLGVYEARLVPLLAQVLLKLGSRRAMVVHGADGVDEISLSGPTRVAEIREGKIEEYEMTPEDFNMKREPVANLRVASKEESCAAAQRVIAGDNNAASKIVCLNAAAALYLAEKCRSVKEGMLLAMNALENGLVEKKLRQIVRTTQAAS
jgi:anthranilate phosphoribosyltransferase